MVFTLLHGSGDASGAGSHGCDSCSVCPKNTKYPISVEDAVLVVDGASVTSIFAIVATGGSFNDRIKQQILRARRGETVTVYDIKLNSAKIDNGTRFLNPQNDLVLTVR